MAALHLLATQSTQLPRASTAVVAMERTPSPPPPSPQAYAAPPGLPVYPYARETPHPLLSGALRRGKWTSEEEAYAAAIIQYFLSGVLPIQYGTTLRGYIAQLLHCDPMRVSKKLIPGSIFVGVRIDPKIGRRSYYPCPVDTPGLDGLKDRAEHHLAQLRAAFVESIEREEEQEQAAMQPRLLTQRGASPGVAVGLNHSPLKRKRSDRDDDQTTSQATPPPPPNHFAQSRAPNLPSLTQLLWQSRQPPPPAPPAPHPLYQYASAPPVYERHTAAMALPPLRSPMPLSPRQSSSQT